jgi:hypothetical protein
VPGLSSPLPFLQELGNLLDVSPKKAEQLASEMIGEGRLQVPI